MSKKTVKEPAQVSEKPAKPTVEEVLAGTESGTIWNEIRFKEIQMFALPGQTVSHYCRPVVVEPSKLYLVASASSVLPSLEEAVGKNYVVESVDKYIVVSRVPTFPFFKK